MQETTTNPTQETTDKANAPTQEKEHLPARFVENHDGILARWDKEEPILGTNLDVTLPKTATVIGNALATCERKTRDCVGQIIEAVGVIFHVAEVANTQTGEVEARLRAVIVTPTGETISTMSTACLRILKYHAKYGPKHKWDPPKKFKVRSWPLAGGKSYNDMVEIVEPTQAQAPPKKK